MATIVKSIPKAKRGRPELYPWNTWFDGKVRKLTSGKDFLTQPYSFSMTARQAASRKGVGLSVAIRGNDVYLKASKLNTKRSR